MVVVSHNHPAYGRLLEIDHGNSLITRYAHASKLLVKNGEMVKRGQKIAEVGSSGRSTGPHLHFEVLVAGVPQNPTRFLAGKGKGPAPMVADVGSALAQRRPLPSLRSPEARSAELRIKPQRERQAAAPAGDGALTPVADAAADAERVPAQTPAARTVAAPTPSALDEAP
jgi:pyruvate/2-oxoglutarate dehydrogenase complex dihydrolipoamide acyltransferase (E2) component